MKKASIFSLTALVLTAVFTPAAAGSTVEIGVHAEDNTGPAYLTWAPVKAWARLAQAGPDDVAVVLTNDSGATTKTPCGLRTDGDVAFAATEPPAGQTASAPQLELTLPKSGESVLFYLAGSHPQASTEDGDAVIEVHAGSADGELIADRELMVRVRKEVKCLTESEWKRFLDAIHDLHFEENQYWPFVEIHDWAARGKRGGAFGGKYPEYPGKRFPFPDQAHGGPNGPAFLPWHRTYLLQFERLLQSLHPDIALPYWPVNQPNSKTGVFTLAYMGANPTGGTTVEPTFASGHPLEHWQMPNADNPSIWEPIQRTANDRDSVGSFIPDQYLFNNKVFKSFAAAIESNPHNIGHNWIGPWMQNCRVSPRDPIFWVFHTWFDMMWGQWQHKYGRFGDTADDYSPQGKYDPSLTVPVGHYAEDTMWPWNEVTGPPGAPVENPTDKEYFLSRPPTSPTGPFKVSGVPGIWPESPATPTPVSMVDYAGVQAGHHDTGFAYDKVPFGDAMAKEKPSFRALSLFVDRSQPAAVRAEAGKQLDVSTDEEHAESVKEVLKDQETDDSVRSVALMSLVQSEHPEAHPHAVKILSDPDDGGEQLDVAAVTALSVLTMFTSALDAEQFEETHEVLSGALEDSRPAVRTAAMETLAERKHPSAIEALRDALASGDESRFSLRPSILQLAAAVGSDSFGLIRPYLNHPDAAVRAAAVSVLGADPESRRALEFILRDSGQPASVRTAAIGALLYHDKNFARVAFEVIEDPETTGALEDSLMRALRNHSSKLNPAGLTDEERAAIRARLAER